MYLANMKTQKGYTLLFAVIVSVLVLSIAAFILSVSRKQAILSSSARDSVYAFYAADSGLECGIENLASLAKQVPDVSISCANQTVKVSTDSSQPNTAQFGTSTFYLYTGSGTGAKTTQSGIGSCASVMVTYVQTKAAVMSEDDPPVELSPAEISTAVTSRGYNIGWNPPASLGGTGPDTGDCSITGPRKVERAILYTQS